jgi:hypothetical protein
MYRTRQNAPFDLQVETFRGGDDLKIISVLVEEVMLGEKFGPARFPNEHLVHNVGTCTPRETDNSGI